MLHFERTKGAFDRISLYFLLFILAFSPVFFGSTHPLVQGLVAGLLLLYGAVAVWRIPLQLSSMRAKNILWFFLFFWVLLQSLPLPLAWLHLFAPVRAYWLEALNSLAHTELRFAAISYLGAASLFHLALYASVAALYFLARTVFAGKDGRFHHRLVCMVLVCAGILEAIYGIFQFINPKLGVLWLPIPSRAAHGTIIYTNQYGALLNLCWPQAWGLALYYLHRAQPPVIRPSKQGEHKEPFYKKMFEACAMPKETYALFMAAALMMAAVLFSLSRGAMLSLAIIWIILQVLMPVPSRKRLAVLTLFLGFFLVLGLFLDFSVIWKRFGTIEDSGLTRLQLYAASLPLLSDHWLAGAGLGAYSLLSPLYLKHFPGTIHFDHAHNEFLELGIEAGLPVTIIAVSAIVFFLARSFGWISRIRQKEYVHQSRIAAGIAAWCALLGFFLHGTVDFGWRLPVNLFYAAILLAQVSLLHKYCSQARGQSLIIDSQADT